MGPSARPSTQMRVRGWRPEDAAATAHVWKKALLDTGLTSHGKVQSAQRSLSLQQDVASAMCRMHARKAAAAAVSRKVRCDMASMLQQHGAGPPGPIGSGQPSQELFAAVQKLGMATQRELAVMWDQLRLLRRKRLWSTLVAELREAEECAVMHSWADREDFDDGRRCSHEQAGTSRCTSNTSQDRGGSSSAGKSWRQAGYVVLSLSQPLAVLPPPFPSASPLYLHIDGLAVAPEFRRQGVGTALLSAAERLARAWGRRSIWLHVDADNKDAQSLYVSLGYTVVRMPTWPWQRQVIMSKTLPLQQRPAGAHSEQDGNIGSNACELKAAAETSARVYSWGEVGSREY